MKVHVVCVLSLMALCWAERRGEHGRVHDHRHEEYKEPVVSFAEEEDDHRGIPVVEDDIPEWVKLTFPDKFIALGTSEFLSLGDFAEELAGDVGDEDELRSFGNDDDEYEYVYSDEEGFEFDPHRDKLVNHKPVKLPKEDDMMVYDDEASDAEKQDDNGYTDKSSMSDVLRSSFPSKPSSAPISIPINPEETWKHRMQSGVADAVVMLEEGSVIKIPSHAPGSRRNRRVDKRSGRTTEQNIPVFSNRPHFHQPVEIPSRYRHSGVRLNERDPRFRNSNILGGSSFLEVDEQAGELGDQPDIKLPTLERHMYSSGLPVADWEVGYVDEVLKGFGF